MSDDVEELKHSLRRFMASEFERVPPKRETSRQVHLEVWRARQKPRPVALEMDHADRVNLWVLTYQAPKSLPPGVEVTPKEPKKPKGWTDADGRGANSNLSAYDEFHSKPITRLGVRTEADARLILDHLLR